MDVSTRKRLGFDPVNGGVRDESALRAASGARKVTLGKMPRGVKQKIAGAYKREGDPRMGRRWDVAMRLINDERWDGLFDHYGSSVWRGIPTFATEPYRRDGSDDIEETARKFALWAGLALIQDGPCWWAPGSKSAKRFEFAVVPHTIAYDYDRLRHLGAKSVRPS